MAVFLRGSTKQGDFLGGIISNLQERWVLFAASATSYFNSSPVKHYNTNPVPTAINACLRVKAAIGSGEKE